eukprot:CAMPEP_0194154812 /NCGR_PEP_ID=MMETSP0152-20130528/62017_1 /TAXON_ID=1049557 /ORGANISM="Thalassiothrix antarctica, Strain L6-D1" /LENGTH=213 /DNA_ID=CAMNT_0038861171 /DNA_START=108 /DNA_END=746 /DNA_ORIENTATION=+
MGRSQVAYNQRKGRPGQQKGGRGRGRGKEDTDSKTQSNYRSKRDLGDNSWRYQETSNNDIDENNHEQLLEEKLLSLEAYGKYSNQIKDDDEEMNSNDSLSFVMKSSSLNMKEIKESLDTLPLSDLLGLPPHLTEALELESRRGRGLRMMVEKNNNEKNPSLTIKEGNDNRSSPTIAIKNEKIMDDDKRDCNINTSSPEKSDSSTNSDDDDDDM